MQKGIALYLTIAIMAVLTTTLLAVISLAVSQIKIMWTIGDSVVAFYAADTGAERVLYDLYKGGWTPTVGYHYQDEPIGDAFYDVYCAGTSPLQIRSTGTFENTSRKVELNF